MAYRDGDLTFDQILRNSCARFFTDFSKESKTFRIGCYLIGDEGKSPHKLRVALLWDAETEMVNKGARSRKLPNF